MPYGIGNDCDECDCDNETCPDCAPGSLSCTACGTVGDLASVYQIRFAGWINKDCDKCEERNVTVEATYLDNHDSDSDTPADCWCHFRGTFDWRNDDCETTSTSTVDLWIFYDDPSIVGSGQCLTGVLVKLSGGGSGEWGLAVPQHLPCNYFDSEVELIGNGFGVIVDNPDACDSDFGTIGPFNGFVIKCFLQKVL